MSGCGNRTTAVCVCLWLPIIVAIAAGAGLPRFEHPPAKADGSLTFLVVGDWGRKGEYNQSLVASKMGRIGDQLGIDFVVSTGDNFYDDGLTGHGDPAFVNSFSNIYTASSLNKPWYTVLGNHDYRGDVLAQLNPALRRIDPRWVCFRSFVVDSDVAELFFVDTNPFVRKYFTDPKDHVYDWRGVLPVDTYIARLLEDLDSALKSSKATWKIIVAHHPIRSAGHHGDTQDLHHQLLPILLANNIDLYINGHDHCLEHISDQASGIEYLTSGAGSKAWRGGLKANAPGLQFYHDGQGFMSVEATRSHVQIIFYDVFGKVGHKWLVSKQDLHPIL